MALLLSVDRLHHLQGRLLVSVTPLMDGSQLQQVEVRSHSLMYMRKQQTSLSMRNGHITAPLRTTLTVAMQALHTMAISHMK